MNQQYMLRLVAAELNNIGVLLQKRRNREGAAYLYANALQAMTDSVAFDTGNDSGGNRSKDQCSAWKIRLKRLREAAGDRHGLGTAGNGRIAGVRSDLSSQMQSRLHKNSKDRLAFHIQKPFVLNMDEAFTHSKGTESACILHNMGLLQLQSFSMDKADEFFQMALSLIPDGSPLGSIDSNLLISIHCSLGLIRFHQGKKDEALFCFQYTLKLGAKFFGNSLAFASILSTIGKNLLYTGFSACGAEVFDAASEIFKLQPFTSMTAEYLGNENPQAAASA